MSHALDPLACSVEGAGPPLVLVHGLTFSRHSWDPIVDRLKDRFTCIAVDLPGHGESAGSAREPRLVVERICATVAGLHADPPVVVGHSAGAIHASAYAAIAPARGVVNIDQTPATAGVSHMLRQLEPALRGPDFAAAFAPFETSIGVAALPEPERSRVQATRSIRQDVVLDHWNLLLTGSPADTQHEVSDLLDHIQAPYLWIASQATDVDREYLLAHIPQAEIDLWPEAGHVLHLADPDRFCDRLARFAAACQPD